MGPALNPQRVLQHKGRDFWVANQVETTLTNTFEGEIRPVTVIDVPGDGFDAHWLRDKLRDFDTRDDVFSMNFLRDGALLLQHVTSDSSISEDILAMCQELSVLVDHLKLASPEKQRIREGPYFQLGNTLRQAWRLYPDTLDAFVTSVVPSSESPYRFESLPFKDSTGIQAAIAVPSRLYFKPSKEKPLHGSRISIKDLFHLEGTVTTIGSRSYSQLYGRQTRTSNYVKTLIDAGAVIVGKTKMSAFAGSEIPPEKCIDYYPSWNARGDGYITPSGSSMGAGSTMSGYSWLDSAIATDSNGSMRMPASAHGTWALRMSNQAVSMEHAVTSIETFDTVGLMARSPVVLESLLYASQPRLTEKFKQPSRILYPNDFFPMGDTYQQEMVETFIKAVESNLGMKRTEVSIADEWAKSCPKEADGKALKDYLDNPATIIDRYDNYHSFHDFRTDYQRKFDKPPYVSPWHSRRWTEGANFSSAQRAEAGEKIQVFTDWIKGKYLTSSLTQPAGAVMVMPLGRAFPAYRDEALAAPSLTTDFTPTYFTTVLGLPLVVVPVGQKPYQSRISKRTEYVPLVASLVGPRGSDAVLLRIAQEALQKAGMPIEVDVGPTMFPVDREKCSNSPSCL